MARVRGLAAGRFALELDGAQAGWLTSVSGGDAEGEVVHEPVGPDAVVRKHLGSVRYTDIELAAGAGMEKAFFDWVAATLTQRFTRKDGTVVSVDSASKEVARLSFFNAIVREITFPALDAASKEAAQLTVRVSPEFARRSKGSGAKVTAPSAGKRQKTWLPSNFRLKIDSVDCKNVSKIQAITVEQKAEQSQVGEMRDAEKDPAHAEIGDLVVTVAESHSADFVGWHDDFVIKGNNGAGAEKTGTLEFLAPDLKEVLFTLEFKGLGIFKLEREAPAGTGETIRMLRASIYCEELVFTPA